MQHAHAHLTRTLDDRDSGQAESRRSWFGRLSAALSAVTGVVAGIAPHLLHHVTLIAGTALLTGAAGSVIFGVLGFVVMTPMLLRLRRHFGAWLAPGVALALFVAMFTVSTVWIGPAIRGDNGAPAQEQHDHNGPGEHP